MLLIIFTQFYSFYKVVIHFTITVTTNKFKAAYKLLKYRVKQFKKLGCAQFGNVVRAVIMSTSLLKITSTELLHRFLHYCVDELITKSNCGFNIGSEDVEWTKDDQISATNFIQNLYRENILNKSEEFTLTNSDINPKFQELIRQCYEIRKDQIFQAVLCEELHTADTNLVENIDWKLKWIMGSSKLATLREPLLQVDLHCFKKDNKTTRKTVNFEMNIDTVHQLISDLENVQKSLVRNK